MSTLRGLSIPLGIIAAVLLAWLMIPWETLGLDAVRPEGTLRLIVTVGFWIAFVILIVALFQERRRPHAEDVEIQGPAFTRFLFFNSRAGLFWLPIRLFLGFAWLESGIGKLQNPQWTQGGEALRAYWERAISIPEAPARPPITYEWYREFLTFLVEGNHETWFSWVIMFGEVAVGVGLIIGMLTGIAAFFGAFMNMSFLLAGTASTNPVLFTLAIGLILAWRVAGYYGVDRYLLPMLGTPWRPGAILARRDADPAAG